MPRAVSTPQFTKCIRQLVKKGKKGKDAKMKALAAKGEADEAGEISILKRTNHGESRLPNIEKYDLGDAYRLVVQLVDSKDQVRAFLYVGDHEDTERWLDNHRDYKWVRREDNTLDFVKCSEPGMPLAISQDVDEESPESLLELPMLRDISDELWSESRIPPAAVVYLQAITADRWETDPSGVVEHLESISSTDAAYFGADILEHAHKREWPELHSRFALYSGHSSIVTENEIVEAIDNPVNSERFITWDDIEGLGEEASWSDWMLFLHAEQKEFSNKDYNGPARLRGVSGSGKTCVMVHRARRLAKLYQQKVMLVTLTESMRQLLDVLKRDLCGAEAAFIETATMNGLAKRAIIELSPGGEKDLLPAQPFQIQKAEADALKAIKQHPDFSETILASIPDGQLQPFLLDEISFVRMRFLPKDFVEYLDVKRHGRGLALPAKARKVVLSGVQAFHDTLERSRSKDPDAIVQSAYELLTQNVVAARNTFQYRCVLVDEVQDLSELEIKILAEIPNIEGEKVSKLPNGLFLVGDGAQTIYKKGFALRNCGVNVANRSFVLQKNYRNTKEILQAAYGIISDFKFNDVDEDNIQKPTEPDMSSRHGERPFLVKCGSEAEETQFVVTKIKEIIEDQRLRDEANELEFATEIPIGVIGFNRGDRDRIFDGLRKANIPAVELRDDVSWDSNAVKISTLESAKGHEFHAVFIVGVEQGTIPHQRLSEGEWDREASRLYVAMTRARDQLFLSYQADDRNRPSVFLAKMQADCTDCEFKRGRLSIVD